MKPNEYEAWGKVREKGIYKYILINGALSYGLPMFLVMYFLINKPSSSGNILMQILVWLMAGFAFGLIMWLINERRFKKVQLGKKQLGTDPS